MKAVGIICEYNPIHNGHLYHIEKVKQLFPDSIIVLVLNGYFLERGEISILSKEEKTELALLYGIDLVVELPVVFGTQSADIFAEKALEILNHLHVTDILFGSESNDSDLLIKIAELQLEDNFDSQVRNLLKSGINYPTALFKALNLNKNINEPNDLLGISYAKAILKHNYPIKIHTIKRTSEYHDTVSNERIISASNIRKKMNNKEDITNFVPQQVPSLIHHCNEELLFKLLQYKMITSNDLSIYLTVDEGIEKRLKKVILECDHLEDFLLKVKTKRYTYNKIRRMIIHILLGLTKEKNDSLTLEYIHILGFSNKGQKYLNYLRNKSTISFKPLHSSAIYEYEKRASFLYDILMNTNTKTFEIQNTPIKKDN